MYENSPEVSYNNKAMSQRTNINFNLTVIIIKVTFTLFITNYLISYNDLQI